MSAVAMVLGGHLFGLGVAFVTLLAHAAVAQNPGLDEIPPLRPPRGEIPPDQSLIGLWQEHPVAVTLGVLLLLILGAALARFLTRRKTTSPVAPEVQVCKELTSLRGQPETGALLSRISASVRRYASAVFSLPVGELTTAEFRNAVAGNETVGIPLAKALTDFLVRCDERKFAPPSPQPPMGAADEALKLVEVAEARREELRQVAARQKGTADTVSK